MKIKLLKIFSVLFFVIGKQEREGEPNRTAQDRPSHS